MSKSIQTTEEIMQGFHALLAEQKAAQHSIKTKEEAAIIAQNKELVTTVAEYKPDLIVKGAADLRLAFTISIEQLGEQLQKELEINGLAFLQQKLKVLNCMLMAKTLPLGALVLIPIVPRVSVKM